MPSITVLTVREDNLLLVYRKWQISLQIELPPRSLTLVSLAWIVLARFWSKDEEVKSRGTVFCIPV